MKHIRVFAALCCLVFVAACAPKPDVNVDYNDSWDFQSLKTYTLDRSVSGFSRVGGVMNPMWTRDDINFPQAVERAVSISFKKLGYREQPVDPDFIVVWHIQPIYDEGAVGDDAPSASHGRLILEFLDGETRENFWKGTAEFFLNPDTSQPIVNKQLAHATELFFENYPPEKKK